MPIIFAFIAMRDDISTARREALEMIYEMKTHIISAIAMLIISFLAPRKIPQPA